MVLSETQRLERFENAVFADADRQAKQIADETQEEIAQILKLSRTAVQTRVSRARNQLKKELSKYE